MAKIVAIADDLTGAADCAAACATHGMSAIVLLHDRGRANLDGKWPEVDVVSIDANTRGATAGEAAETTGELARMVRERTKDAILFKKVDSTLRGNLAWELAAVLGAHREASGNNFGMIMAPALPAQGRTTVGGRQMVHGRLLEETDLWKSEGRLAESDISKALTERGLSCRIVDLEMVRGGESRLAEAISSFSRGVDVVVCDAETDHDLRMIANAAVGRFRLWAGSAGLAAQLPHVVGPQSTGTARREFAVARGPALMVVGSAASISRQQSEILAASSDVVTVRFSWGKVRTTNSESDQVVEALKRGSDTLVVFEGDEEFSVSQAQVFAEALSGLISPCAGLLGGVIATGGETARAVLDGLGIRRLQLLGEIEPGIPVSVAEGWTRPLPVVTKAGAFGSPTALVRCREFLCGLRSGAMTESQRLFNLAR